MTDSLLVTLWVQRVSRYSKEETIIVIKIILHHSNFLYHCDIIAIIFMSHRAIPMIAFVNYIHIYNYIYIYSPGKGQGTSFTTVCSSMSYNDESILLIHQTFLYHSENTFLSKTPSVYIQAMCICRLCYKSFNSD